MTPLRKGISIMVSNTVSFLLSAGSGGDNFDVQNGGKIKKIVFGILAVLIATSLSAQQTFVLPSLEKPHQLVVDGNDLYIFDEADYSLSFYTISPFALKLKFGKKGDGPQDFKYLPMVYVQPETLVCTDFSKTLWFSKDGRFLKVKPYSDFKMLTLEAEIILHPVRDNFVLITADHNNEKRNIDLLNTEFRTINVLYEGPFIWRTEAPIHYRTDTVVHNGQIYISDTQKGFYITVFDDHGNHLLTIDKSREVEKVPNFPLLHQYCVSGDKIYAVTYKKKDNKTEMIVLDLKGRILKRLYLPLTSIQPKRGVLRYDLFTVSGEKLYEVVKNAETGKWELLITDLESK
jgi:hypothetical protein